MGILGKEWRVDGAAKKREYTGKYQLVLPSIHPDIERESDPITQSENEREPGMIYSPDQVIPSKTMRLSNQKVNTKWGNERVSHNYPAEKNVIKP